MCSDIELLINLIYMTETMESLKNKDFDKYLSCIEQTQDWEKFKQVSDIINLNDKYIDKAIEEIIQSERLLNIIKENTDININDFNIKRGI